MQTGPDRRPTVSPARIYPKGRSCRRRRKRWTTSKGPTFDYVYRNTCPLFSCPNTINGRTSRHVVVLPPLWDLLLCTRQGSFVLSCLFAVENLGHREARVHLDACFLRLLPHPSHQLRQRHHVVSVVALHFKVYSTRYPNQHVGGMDDRTDGRTDERTDSKKDASEGHEILSGDGSRRLLRWVRCLLALSTFVLQSAPWVEFGT